MPRAQLPRGEEPRLTVWGAQSRLSASTPRWSPSSLGTLVLSPSLQGLWAWYVVFYTPTGQGGLS